MRRSGKYGYIDGIACLQSWQFNKQASVSRYAASCTPGGSATAAGNIDVTGSMAGIGYLPPLPSETDMAFVGVASAAVGEVLNYEGDVLVYETVLNFPKAQGGVINWSANWGAQGDLVKSTSTAYSDDTREPGPPASKLKISIEGTPDSDSWSDVADVQAATLTFRMPPVTSVEGGFVYREAGNLECDLSFEVNNDDEEVALYALNAIKRVRVYVTDSLFYMLDAVQFGAHSNFRVVRGPTPQMIGYTVNGMWTALRSRTPAALGEILLPGGSQFYGEEES
jgi:hypothetical protein